MKISLHSLEFITSIYFIIVTLIFSFTSAKNHLLAVSPLVGAENYYVFIRKKRLGKLIKYSSYPAEEPIIIKENICSDIFGSVLFDSYEVDPINPYLNQKYPNVYDDLKRKYPTIYEKFYESRKFPNDIPSTNPYQVRNVTISKKSVYQEYMFVCLARNRKSQKIEQYFVSRKYDVNEYTRHTTRRIEGRFVFTCNERNQMVVIALAEEPAQQSFDQNSIEGIYMEYTQKRIRKIIDQVDPLCSLTKARKVRLCTIILSAIQSVRFVPHESNVDPDCEKKEITFTRKFKKKIASRLQEWMTGCKTENITSKEPITYYISRGYTHNTCYVYKQMEGQIVFDHLSTDVGIYLIARTYMNPT